MQAHQRPAAVDLFCGAGGLSYGMKHSGIEIVAGVDADPACQHPFSHNVETDFHARDIGTVTPEFVGSLFPENRVRILAGCAPCQPYSTYTNKRTGKDRDWRLLQKFGELVSELKPDIVTMENVPQLQHYSVFDKFIQTLRNSGYGEPFYEVVHCASYGVPQSRKRLVVLASRLGEIGMIGPTHEREDFLTVRKAIGEGKLGRIEAGSTDGADHLHKASRLSPKNLSRIRNSRPGGTWMDWDEGLRATCHSKESGQTYSSVYGRMGWDRLAPTLTTQFNGFGNGRFGHPEQDRAISLREGAILQTFPRDYSFVPEGTPVSLTQIARMIGNAVPVMLGKAIGKSIMDHLEKHTSYGAG